MWSSLGLSYEDREPDIEARRSVWLQDQQFCDAMLAAAQRHLEHPPMVGIDTRPGTRSPIVLAR